jgi:hypothetical protein
MIDDFGLQLFIFFLFVFHGNKCDELGLPPNDPKLSHADERDVDSSGGVR